MTLPTVWFVIVAVFWTGFFVLEGFDFGVGALHAVVGRTDVERRVAINTIGPFWDGNEVWLVVGGGGHVRRLPRLVRHLVLRALPGAAAAARGADRPRRLVRVPRQGDAATGGARRGARADGRQRCSRRPARHRAGRPAGGPADRRGPAVHRHASGPPHRLRALDRPDPAGCCACSTARRSWPCAPPATWPQRARRSRRAAGAGGPGGRGRRLRDLDGRHAPSPASARYVLLALALVARRRRHAQPARQDRDGRAFTATAVAIGGHRRRRCSPASTRTCWSRAPAPRTR